MKYKFIVKLWLILKYFQIQKNRRRQDASVWTQVVPVWGRSFSLGDCPALYDGHLLLHQKVKCSL